MAAMIKSHTLAWVVEIAEIYFPTDLEARSTRPRGQQGRLLLGLWGRISPGPCFSSCLFADTLWYSLACRSIIPSLPLSSHGILFVCLCLYPDFPFYQVNQSYLPWIYPDDLDYICSDSIAKYGHILRYLGARIPTSLFWGTQFN